MWISEEFIGREHELEAIELFETTEPFVDVAQACPGILINMADAKGVVRDEPRALVRLGIAILLNKVEEALPAGIHLMIRDAWRSAATQLNLHEHNASQIQGMGLAKTKKQARKEADRFAARPGGRYPAPHTTGGAVDVTLAFASGTLLPMRKEFAQYMPEEWQAQKARDFQDLPRQMLIHRRMVHDTMESAGFASIQNEWWHFSYGDIWWAARTGKKRTSYLQVTKPNVLVITL